MSAVRLLLIGAAGSEFAVAAEMARKAGEVLGEIDKISASLGKKDGEAPHPEPDKTKNGLREVLNNLRPKTEE